MKKAFCLIFLCSLLALPIQVTYSQEHEMEKSPRAGETRPHMPMPMPGGPMEGMMAHRGMGMMMQIMRDNPKLAGVMMQMHGDMMRIRGEAMGKMGDVLRRYGERLEKESAR